MQENHGGMDHSNLTSHSNLCIIIQALHFPENKLYLNCQFLNYFGYFYS